MSEESLPRSPHFRNLTGMVFGRLRVEAYDFPVTPRASAHWKCICECGKSVTVKSRSLTSGITKSCGCFGKEQRMKSKGNRKHGKSKSPESNTFLGLVRRCTKPNDKKYPIYGGRGITVHQRWLEGGLGAFIEDVGLRPSPLHSLDRIDVNGNYEPGNVRWATQLEQQRNRRNNRIVVVNGQKMCVSSLRDISDVKLGTIRYRLKSGWTIEKAISQPPRAIRGLRGNG